MMPTDTDIVQSFSRQAWMQTFAGPGHLPPVKDQEYQAVRIIGKDNRLLVGTTPARRSSLHQIAASHMRT